MIVVVVVVEANEEDVPMRAGDNSIDEAPCISPLFFPFSSFPPPPSPLASSSFVFSRPMEH